jgi:hypothetical protein
LPVAHLRSVCHIMNHATTRHRHHTMQLVDECISHIKKVLPMTNMQHATTRCLPQMLLPRCHAATRTSNMKPNMFAHHDTMRQVKRIERGYQWHTSTRWPMVSSRQTHANKHTTLHMPYAISFSNSPTTSHLSICTPGYGLWLCRATTLNQARCPLPI